MPFIGILSDKKNENEFTRIFTNRTQNGKKRFDIIAINGRSIDNIKNIKFDTILIDTNHLPKNKEILIKILKGTKYLIINSDIFDSFELLNDIIGYVITYGFNSKATITTSSIEEGNNLLCVQRSIQAIDNNIVEQQEVMIDKVSSNKYIDMAVVGICLVYNLKI